MSQTVSEMFGYEGESDDDMIILQVIFQCQVT